MLFKSTSKARQVIILGVFYKWNKETSLKYDFRNNFINEKLF